MVDEGGDGGWGVEALPRGLSAIVRPCGVPVASLPLYASSPADPIDARLPVIDPSRRILLPKRGSRWNWWDLRELLPAVDPACESPTMSEWVEFVRCVLCLRERSFLGRNV